MQSRIALATLVLSVASLAHAGDFGNHPAVKTRPATIDASLLMYGHPASPLTRGSHANFDHPAVVARRGTTGIDASALMYGHPASPLNGADTESASAATAATVASKDR